MRKTPSIDDERAIFLTMAFGTTLSGLAQSSTDPHEFLKLMQKRIAESIQRTISENAQHVCLNDLQVAIDQAKYDLAKPNGERSINVNRVVTENVISVDFPSEE